MTHSLKIADNASFEVDFTTDHFLIDYTQATAPITSQEAISTIRDGGEIINSSFRNVTESARIQLTGANGAAIQTTINSLERAFERLKRRRRVGAVNPIYVKVQMDSDTEEWQSEILEARIELADRTWDLWSNNHVEVIIIWTRRYYWETVAEKTLVLQNGIETNVQDLTVYLPSVLYEATTISFDGTNETIDDSASGLGDFTAGDTIYIRGSGSNDGTYTLSFASASSLTVNENLVTESAGASVVLIGPVENYATLPLGTPVEGNIPTPPKIQLLNRTGSSVNSRDFYIGHNVHSSGLDETDLTLQGEASANGTTSTAAEASAGFYQSATWSADEDHGTSLFKWTITDSQIDNTNGNYFRVMMKPFDNPPSDVYVKVQVKASLTTIYETEEVLLTTSSRELQDLGVIQLPPALIRLDSSPAMDLTLTVRNAAGGTLTIDYIQLMVLDSWRHIKQIGYQIPDGNGIVDDNRTGETYYVEGATGQGFPITTGLGAPLMLFPNHAQDIYFLLHALDGSEYGQKWEAKITYHPRRLTV